MENTNVYKVVVVGAANVVDERSDQATKLGRQMMETTFSELSKVAEQEMNEGVFFYYYFESKLIFLARGSFGLFVETNFESFILFRFKYVSWQLCSRELCIMANLYEHSNHEFVGSFGDHVSFYISHSLQGLQYQCHYISPESLCTQEEVRENSESWRRPKLHVARKRNVSLFSENCLHATKKVL